MSYASRWSLALASLCVATSALALTPKEERAMKEHIQQEHKAAKHVCKSLAGNAKDVCEKEADGREKVAKAELDLRKKDDPKHRHALAKTRADADYAIAKEKCDDLKGNAEDVCKKDAKAAHVRALEAAKVSKAVHTPEHNAQSKAAAVSEARKDASAHVREADYKAAKERCDVLAGSAKDTCINDAKRVFGQ